MKKENTGVHPIFQLKNPWENHTHKVWLASNLALTRNLQKYKFPHKLDKSREHQVLSVIQESLLKCSDLKNPELFRSEEILKKSVSRLTQPNGLCLLRQLMHIITL